LLAANVVVTVAWIVPYVCRLLDEGIVRFLRGGLGRPILAAAPMALVLVGLERVLPADTLLGIVLNVGAAGGIYAATFYALARPRPERA
jgi:hypothetical protein